MSAPDRLFQQLLDKDAIRDLVYRYSYCADTNRSAEYAALFTEDCVFDPGPGNGGPVHGREQVEALRRRSKVVRSSHHNTNVLIAFDGPDSARLRTSLYAWHQLADGSQPMVWGYYDDIVVRRDDRWLFAERVIRIYGEQGFDASWHPGERLTGTKPAT